jgi:AcrR family transcriptional regulator
VPTNNNVSAAAIEHPKRSRTGAHRRPRRTQEQRSAESARRLMDAAIELIAEKGFDRTSAAEIGERAGYSRSMVRARYGSKDALLESIFGGELDRRLLPAGEEDLTGLPWVLARVDHVAQLLEEERELMRAFCVISFEAAGPIPSLRSWYSQWLAHYEREMADHLRAGQRDGTVRPGIDPDTEAHDFVLKGIGLVFRWTLDEAYDLAGQFRAWRAQLERAYSSQALPAT